MSAIPPRPFNSRRCYAAAHVCMLPEYADLGRSLDDPSPPEELLEHLDWPTTLAFRQRLSDLGFGIAEAMDTAQRFDLGWPGAQALIESTAALNLASGFCAGAGTDHMESVASWSDLVDGVLFQADLIARAGGVPVILPMPRLTAERADAATYREVYGAIARGLNGPAILHWLGPMFLASLEGYFPGDSFLEVMRAHPEVYRGAKLSLLDADLEVHLRRELAATDQLIFTGDDFHFARLIRGGDPHTDGAPLPETKRSVPLGPEQLDLGDFSHALLGILDGIAAPASRALAALDTGDERTYLEAMLPLEALGRHVFEPPTQHYKAGLAHLAHWAGHQPNPLLPHRADRARPEEHLTRLRTLAARAGLPARL
jgi:hypothetical protein